MSDLGDPGRLMLYAPDGSFLSAFGRTGDGPGEYRMPRFHSLDPTGDTLLIVDPLSSRITLLSANDRQLLSTRAFPAPGTMLALFLSDGTIIANGLHFGDEHIGLPLRLISREGELKRSFGADRPLYFTAEGDRYVRMMDQSHDGALWAAHPFRYRIEKWDTMGRLLHRIERDVDWFPVVEEPNFPREPDAAPPTPIIMGVWESEPGLLWVASRVAAPDWRGLFELVEGPSGEKRYRVREPDEEIWQTRIELLDATTGELLASRDFRPSINGMLGSGFFHTRSVDEYDVPFVDVWRLTRSPPSPRRLP